MGPLNVEIKLQVDEILKMYNIINFKTIRYKVTASGIIIQSILNHKLMRLVNT